MTNKFKVKIPGGYLMVEEKGAENDFPGVFVSFSENGEQYDVNNLITCVECDSCDKEIKTETYCKNFDEPVNIIRYSDGRDLI